MSSRLRLRHSAPTVVAVVLATLGGAGLLAWSPSATSPAGIPTELGNEVPVTATDQLRMPANNSPIMVSDPTDERLVVMANRLDAPDFGCALHLSGDGGRTWVPTNLPSLPAGAEKCYGPELAFDGKGVLYFLFVGLHTRGNLPMGAFLTASFDQGRSFTAPRAVLGPLNFGVRMAIDPTEGRHGRIHLAWLHANSEPPLGGFPKGPNPVFASYSDDGGDVFSKPVRVTDVDRARVVAPTLALGSGHAVHVGYYDLGNDVRDYEGLAGPVWEGRWSVVVSSSTDGGRTFRRAVAVEPAVVPPERPILIFTMASPALAANGDRVCVGWADARHGDADVLARCSANRGRTWGTSKRVNDDARGNGLVQYLPRLSIAPGGRLDAIFLDRRYNLANRNNDVSYTYSNDGGRTFAPSRRLTEVSWSPLVGQQYAGAAAAGQVEIGSRLGLLSRRSGALAAWPDTRYPTYGPSPMGQDVFTREIHAIPQNTSGWLRSLSLALLAAGFLCGLAAVRQRHPASHSIGGGMEQEQARESPSNQTAQRHLTRTFGAVVLAAGLAGGGVLFLSARGKSRTAGALDLVPQVVDVTMTEYHFSYRPPLRSGRTVFRVRNAGAEKHVFGLYPLPNDLPPINDQLHGGERRPIDSPAELPTSDPGEIQAVAVDLSGGQRYAFLCFLATPSHPEIHALLGMNTEFRVP